MVLHGLPITLDDNGNRGEIRCYFDKFHQFPVTHFSDDNLEEAGSDRFHGGQTDTCNTIRSLGDSCTCDTFGEKYHWSPHLHRHPTTHDFGDGNNPHEVFPAHLGDGTIGNCNSKRPHGLPVTHFDGESNKEEVHIDELHGGERDARYTLRKLDD